MALKVREECAVRLGSAFKPKNDLEYGRPGYRGWLLTSQSLLLRPDDIDVRAKKSGTCIE